jgi:hypothetical protein
MRLGRVAIPVAKSSGGRRDRRTNHPCLVVFLRCRGSVIPWQEACFPVLRRRLSARTRLAESLRWPRAGA